MHISRSSYPATPLRADALQERFGVEQPLHTAERGLRSYVQTLRPPVVGALHLTCSDEAEYEVASIFRRDFVRTLLPALHFDDKSPFRTANLGARYEWGSIRIAEQRFSQARGADEWKLMILKINAHVGVDPIDGEPAFGRLDRYGQASPCCGFLHALVAGRPHPYMEELLDAFGTDGVDRLATLREAPLDHRALLTAAVAARLQARRAMLDVQDHTFATPTVTMILPYVSFNRRHHDSEMLIGTYVCDKREAGRLDEYCGLGDLPAEYRLSTTESGVRLEDPDMRRPRPARDHRRLILEEWKARRGEVELRTDDRLSRAVLAARARKPGEHQLSRAALKTLLGAAAAVSPVPAALLLFGEGALAIHHATKANRLLREAEGDAAARAMLVDVQHRLDELDAVETQHLLDLLAHEYSR